MLSFLGLEGPLSRFEGARVVLLPVPYDGSVSAHAGARHAPQAILAASEHIEEYDEELQREPLACGIHVAEPVESDVSDPATLVMRVRSRCDELLSAGKFVITLGGDHTVAVGAGASHAAHHDGVSVLQIDAHADLRTSYDGMMFSHACTARRLGEARGVDRVVGVGIRALSQAEHAFLRDSDHQAFFAQDLAARDEAAWIDEVVAALGPRVYVTFDVDGLDPGILPATGTPEPGGLGWWTALRLLRRVAEERRVVGADVCELLPTPGLHASDVTAARLVYKMIGYFVPDSA